MNQFYEEPSRRIKVHEMTSDEDEAIAKQLRMEARIQQFSDLATAMHAQVTNVKNHASQEVAQAEQAKIEKLRKIIAADWVRQIQKPEIPLEAKIEHLKRQTDYFTERLVTQLQQLGFMEASGSRATLNITRTMNRMFTEALQMLQEQNEGLNRAQSTVSKRLNSMQAENTRLLNQVTAMNQGGTVLGGVNSQLVSKVQSGSAKI